MLGFAAEVATGRSIVAAATKLAETSLFIVKNIIRFRCVFLSLSFPFSFQFSCRLAAVFAEEVGDFFVGGFVFGWDIFIYRFGRI